MARIAYEEKTSDMFRNSPIRIHRLYFPPDSNNLFYLHWHREFEFFLVTKGSARFVVDSREYIIRQGECIFINSNSIHEAYGIDGGECEFLAVVFFDSLLTDDTSSSFYFRYIFPVIKGTLIFTEHFTRDIPWQNAVIELLKSLEDIANQSSVPYELLLKSRLLEIWYLCYSNPHAKAEHQDDHSRDRLRPALDYIHTHYQYDISLSTLADLLPMSTSQFCRLFKKQMEVTPTTYIMRYRILQGCRLLANTDKKIAEIANLSGFNNISYFNKIFQQFIGCTPTVYREGRHNTLVYENRGKISDGK